MDLLEVKKNLDFTVDIIDHCATVYTPFTLLYMSKLRQSYHLEYHHNKVQLCQSQLGNTAYHI